METGNTSPSLSPPLPTFLYLLVPPRVSLSLLRCAFICADYQVQRHRVKSIMTLVMVIATSDVFGFTGNENMTCVMLFLFFFNFP